MKALSIFSFDTLEFRPRLTRAAWGALALFAIARLGLLAGSNAFFTVAETEVQHQYLSVEARNRLSVNPSPRVIVAGTSRFGFLTPECLADGLGCAPEDVANYSRAGNTYWRILVFFRRNPRAMANLDVLLIDLLPYQLHIGPIFYESDPMFVELADAEERARIRSPGARLLALADYAAPIVSQRRRVMGWWDGFARLGMAETERYKVFESTPLPESQRDPWFGLPSEELTREMMNAYAPSAVRSKVQEQALADLRALLPARTRLVLVWPPVREDFRQELAQSQQKFLDFKSFVMREAQGVELIWVDDMAEWGIVPEDYVDVVHFNEDGIRKVCSKITEIIGPLE